jgi:flagellar biosynthesis/type III secretory pathway chaperone
MPERKLLKEALHKARALSDILESEFLYLKDNDLDAFESIQQRKADVLLYLTQQSEAIFSTETAELLELETRESLRALIRTCKDAHTRNALLIDRKLASTKSTLELFRTSHSHGITETYDRLGKLPSKNRPIKQ